MFSFIRKTEIDYLPPKYFQNFLKARFEIDKEKQENVGVINKMYN